MLKTAREVEAKIKAGRPGRWAVGMGAYLQIAKVGQRSTATWLMRNRGDGQPRPAKNVDVELCSFLIRLSPNQAE